MTTSGTATFNLNTNQIVTTALRKVGAIAAGETPDNQTTQDCTDQLNMLVKALNATGLHIWTETEATLFLQPSQTSYTLGGSTTDHATESFTATTLSAAAASGATSIGVVSATGFAATYNVGIVLDSGSIFWTTESGAPSGTTITLALALTGAAASGNAVYVYQTNIIRPLRVVSGRRFAFSGSLDTQMMALSRIDYRNLPNKTNTGVVTQYFYDPRGGANTQGIFYVWPAPADVSSCVKFTWWRPVQDFVAAGNTPDLPNEWIDALVWNLAYKMAPEYDCPPQRYAMLKDNAATSLDLVMGWDREPESYLFGFNADQTGP
ncbi:MAG: hypothetical protein KGL39_30905 [Patescibacteria group bacterium]|nr:hypothetical protein [Patescibacteria group bacterium]